MIIINTYIIPLNGQIEANPLPWKERPLCKDERRIQNEESTNGSDQEAHHPGYR